MAGIGETLLAREPHSRATARPRARFRALPDGALVALIALEDRDAFAELYDRYGATGYRLAYRITRNQQLAEAVVQETFLTVWRQADRFDARRARPATWLLTIAHHKAVDVVRSEQRRRTEPDDQVVERADDSVDVAREAWLGVQRAWVRRALAALPETQREIIELAYFEGHSQTQVARLLGQPLGTVKSRTHGALARLRVLLELEGFAPDSELTAG